MRQFFLGRGEGRGIVVARSRTRLQFEPHGEMKAWRDAIAREARTLLARKGQVLHAAYASAVEADCDAENILFYNLGTGCFRDAAGGGLRFERRYETSKQAAEAGMLHEQTYYLADLTEGFSAWRLGVPVARLGPLSLPVIKADTKPDSVWRAVAEGPVEAITSAEGLQFAVVLDLRRPASGPFNAAAVVKTLLDGVISALHVHNDWATAHAAAQRLGPMLDRDIDEIEELLHDRRRAVLGPRAVVHLRGADLQWNPADHLCVACELRVGPSREGWHLTGAVHLVEPIDATPSIEAAPVERWPGATAAQPDLVPPRMKAPASTRPPSLITGSRWQVFQDDDAGYLRWLTEHPDGVVLNILRSLNASTSRLHRADCRTIKGQPPRGGPWTGPYIKVCADDEADILDWATANARGPIRVCQLATCKSLERSRTGSRPALSRRTTSGSRVGSQQRQQPGRLPR